MEGCSLREEKDDEEQMGKPFWFYLQHPTLLDRHEEANLNIKYKKKLQNKTLHCCLGSVRFFFKDLFVKKFKESWFLFFINTVSTNNIKQNNIFIIDDKRFFLSTKY